MASSRSTDVIDVWDRLVDLVDLQRDVAGEVARALGLTRQHMAAIRALNAGESVTMSVLAERCGCQNANLTAVVNDLERCGFLKRVAGKADKRVRTVSFTPKGERLRAKIEERMRTMPSPLSRLDRASLERLDSELRNALGNQR